MAENIWQPLMDNGLLSENVQEKLLNLIPENSREKLSGLFQRYQQLDEQEKHELLNQLVGRFKQTLHNNMYKASLFERLLYSNSYTIFFFALLFVILILVFFVYKLFKCLSERQIKREEKKKIKQMKKKK
ncbi:uncharacterized protein LOC117603343 isoform X2 [Osmia lignaria lignaria]|uniref:uncharacterized protein LOC117603343 isoform X2 n=1 Tax=Osmia lignaria lignaria TaxID=1437193 RepID=UPI0014783ABF|nr:uncharacterized protein LOC117603343 isoform X2 [Osmia lignaria]